MRRSSREEAAYGGEQERLRGGPGQAAAAHPPHERVVSQPRRPPSPQRVLGADAIKPEWLFSADAIGRTCPRRQRTVAGPQNQTGRAVRALIRLGCRCATPMRAYLPARLPLVGRRAEAYPLTRQNLLLASPCCSGQGNRSRLGNHAANSRFGLCPAGCRRRREDRRAASSNRFR